MSKPAFFVLAIVILMASCKTKETTVQRDVVRDTIYSTKEVVRQPQILEKVYIPNICDTITNTVTEFERVVVIGQDTARLSVIENTLMFEIKKLENIIRQKDSISKKTNTNTSLEREIIKYKTPGWVWLVLAGAIISFLFSIRVWRYF